MKKLALALAVASAFTTAPVVAAEPGSVSVKGFGTVGVTNSNSDEADYVANFYFQPNGVGHTRSTSLGVDSKFGAQVDWQATSGLSLTAQVLSKQNHENSFKPDLEWAFAKFALRPDIDVRAGRIRPAIYMLSDFLDVNYANAWVRPPVEFYSAAPISRIEGIDLLWRESIGDVSLLIQPYFGQSDVDLPGGTTLKARKLMGFNLSASAGDFNYRVGYIKTDVNVKAAGFETGIRPALGAICAKLPATLQDPAACTQLSELDPTDKASSFFSLGASYDNGEYFASGEFGKRKSDSFIADGTSWYLGGGTRMGKWTPHLTYSSFKVNSPKSFTGGKFPGTAALVAAGAVPAAAVAAGLFPALPSTNQIVTAAMQNNPMDQNTLTLGVRYDLMSNVALKAQWDHVGTKAEGAGTGLGMFERGNTLPAFRDRSNTVNIISLSVDFVF